MIGDIADWLLGVVDVAPIWRIVLCTLAGVTAGILYFHGSGPGSSSLAVAGGLGLLGLIAGVVWHWASRTRR